MYNKDDMVIYPGSGVCKIEDIRVEKFGGTEKKQYYILKPIYESQSTTFFVPVESSKIQLRKLRSEKDIYELIKSVQTFDTLWVNEDRVRQEKFSSILKGGNHAEIIKLIQELHEKKSEKTGKGKKLRVSDEKILNEAQKLIHQEFAYTLKIEPEEVAEFIIEQLEKDKK